MRKPLLVTITGTAALALTLGAWIPADAATGGRSESGLAKAEKKNARIVVGKPVKNPPANLQRELSSWANKANATVDGVDCELTKVTLNRHSSCFYTYRKLAVIQRPSGKVIGTALVAYTNTTELNYKRKTYTQNIRLGLVRATGVAVAGMMAKVDLECKGKPGGNCEAESTNGKGPKTLVFPPTTETDYTFKVTSDGTNRRFHQPHPRVTFTHPTTSNKVTVRPGRTAQVRCDSEKVGSNTGRGCVNWRYTPTYTLNRGNGKLYEVAGHIEWAQNNLKYPWGVKGKGKPLHMLKDRKLQKKNRQVACGKATPPPGKSCDEFPFAATYEGAAFNPDYSTNNLNAKQNSYEGGRESRGEFLKNNRVLNFDPFWVKVK